MSTEAYKAFSQKISEDQELKSKFRQVDLGKLDGVIALAKEYGFDVTEEDLLAAAKELESSNELSDDALQKVAGGFFPYSAVAGLVASRVF